MKKVAVFCSIMLTSALLIIGGCQTTGGDTPSSEPTPEPTDNRTISHTAAIQILPAPGSYLSDMSGEISAVTLEDVRVETGICNQDYFPPAAIGPDLKKGDPCLIVSGRVRNHDEERFEIGMAAGGFDATGERVAWTLDAAHIVGAIGLHLEYGETGDFIMHLNPSDDLKTIRIYAANSMITLP